MEAGLALCGPQHCRVMNDLTAGEVSSVLQIHADKNDILPFTTLLPSRQSDICLSL